MSDVNVTTPLKFKCSDCHWQGDAGLMEVQINDDCHYTGEMNCPDCGGANVVSLHKACVTPAFVLRRKHYLCVLAKASSLIDDCDDDLLIQMAVMNALKAKREKAISGYCDSEFIAFVEQALSSAGIKRV
ncbi:hypothetical protein EU508_08270 [Pseudoalteromonas fuliginea]|uniref:Uncharacterized protein n=1 Tax=Pseudoalteromonas fuliginea TaxID=1872678 RepID=A0AB73BHQ1_9GAMM|nr:hypothetical protein [Pseudoalteromonas fuliginea]KAA1161000.1 hypothetical protein EU508_08270 [Pseudoalteromonas fuliginea]